MSFLVLSCFDFGSGPVTPPDSTSDITETADDNPSETDADPGDEVSPLCGNGALDPGEECDDGNRVDGDGCSSRCTITCSADAECRDEDICNGDEICDLSTHECLSGTVPDDGFVCLGSPRSICLSGVCLESMCGDGFVDTGAGETCDPPGVGTCNESCRATCLDDTGCSDDANECNGTEFCDTAAQSCDHRDPLADGSPCAAVPGYLCIARSCQRSRCGDGFADPSVGEECDDSNFMDGDGCDRDCTFSCHGDNDCDDDMQCTDNACDLEMHQCAYPVTSAGALCRPSAGSCDIEESCDGISPACPSDLFESPATVCREAAGSCDVPESCTGGSGRCPTNTFAPSGQACDDVQMCTQGDQCDGSGRCTGTAIDHLYDVAAISSGPYHTCALLDNGQIRCWGLNNHGQLGDGTTMNKIAPAPVSGLPDAARAVSCGAYHTCVVLSSGGIFCWGYNVSGQLGDGTTTDRMTPTAVTALASGVSAVSSGGYHTCALLDSGGVMCWGQNSRGQLGNGSTADSHDPAAVSGLSSGVAAVTAGGYHGCAMLTSGGPPMCWGFNDSGQIGDGSTTNRSTPVAVSMSGGLDTASLAAGRYHTCAVMNTGEMMCWGYNADGQLGDGSTTNRPTPVSVGGLTAEAVTISLGYYHTCGVLLNNNAYCWGQNGYGQLGNGTTSNSPLPVLVVGLGSAAGSMALGYYHTCALLASGETSCWGQNNYGQLGNGSMLDSVAPVQVSCR